MDNVKTLNKEPRRTEGYRQEYVDTHRSSRHVGRELEGDNNYRRRKKKKRVVIGRCVGKTNIFRVAEKTEGEDSTG